MISQGLLLCYPPAPAPSTPAQHTAPFVPPLPRPSPKAHETRSNVDQRLDEAEQRVEEQRRSQEREEREQEGRRSREAEAGDGDGGPSLADRAAELSIKAQDKASEVGGRVRCLGGGRVVLCTQLSCCC